MTVRAAEAPLWLHWFTWLLWCTGVSCSTKSALFNFTALMQDKDSDHIGPTTMYVEPSKTAAAEMLHGTLMAAQCTA
jgi:hypothetical protein